MKKYANKLLLGYLGTFILLIFLALTVSIIL